MLGIEGNLTLAPFKRNGDKMSEEANLVQRFKSNQGLSNKDIATIFQVPAKTATAWIKGKDLDPKAEAVALALNTMMERWKMETGSWNDVDYQHLLKNAENLQKENDSLREEIQQLKTLLHIRKPKSYEHELLEESQVATLKAIEVANNPEELEFNVKPMEVV